MDSIFFPSQYKKALQNRTKNSTIRIKNELGKYKVGRTYAAKSYAGRDWNIKVKILSITRTTLNKLSDLGIPKRSVEATRRKEKLSLNEKVELIRFKVL